MAQPQPSTARAVADFLSKIQRYIREDTEPTLDDLSRMNSVNSGVRDRYKGLADIAGKLGEDTRTLGTTYTNIASYAKQIDSIEVKIKDLELLVEELDRLTAEMDAKVDQLIAPSSQK